MSLPFEAFGARLSQSMSRFLIQFETNDTEALVKAVVSLQGIGFNPRISEVETKAQDLARVKPQYRAVIGPEVKPTADGAELGTRWVIHGWGALDEQELRTTVRLKYHGLGSEFLDRLTLKVVPLTEDHASVFLTARESPLYCSDF